MDFLFKINENNLFLFYVEIITNLFFNMKLYYCDYIEMVYFDVGLVRVVFSMDFFY